MLLTITTTHPPATDLGLPAAQAPGDGVQSFELPSARRTSSTPRRRAERCTAALLLDVDPVGLVRGRAAAGQGSLDAVRQRPALRRLVVPERRASRRSSARRWRAAARSGPELAERRSRSRPRLAVCRAAAARRSCGGCSSRSATTVEGRAAPARRALPRVGREPVLHASTLRATCRAARPAGAPLRADPGARRRQALLGRRRRGREAAAPRRGLAGRPPGARADRAPLPEAPARAWSATRSRAWSTEAGRRAGGRRGAPRRRRPPVERAAQPERAAARRRRGGAAGDRRATRARPRLRRGQAAARACSTDRSFAEIVGLDVLVPRARDGAPRGCTSTDCRRTQRERIRLLHGSLIYRDRAAGGLRRGGASSR